MERPGFFGKLPSHGDFVSRRVPREFLSAWDAWLQQCIAASKEELGDDWLEAYLTSPIWRFAMSAGVCGDRGCLGIMVPSVDRVGRYFPLSIVAMLPPRVTPVEIAAGAHSWFELPEQLLLSVLDDDAPGLEAFDKAVEALLPPVPGNSDEPPAVPPVMADENGAWTLSLPNVDSVSGGFGRLLDHLLAEAIGPYSSWWTNGSESVSGAMLTTRALPSPVRYTAMLAGDPSLRAEKPPSAEIAPNEPEGGDTISLEDLINTPISLSYHSASRTDIGKVRRVNEDALLEKPGEGLWLVADGMGGHADGRTASASVVRKIDELDLPHGFEERVAAVRDALQALNQELRNFAEAHPESTGLGSTVAVLLAEGDACAVIWAGDTRIYRKRGRELEQLTEDHSERQELIERGDIGSILTPSNIVTRAVGGEKTLRLSAKRISVQPGDRFLLCSDGAYDEVPANELFTLLEARDRRAACDAILERVNEGRAQDNATVMVVDASVV